jgi:hypothetical protein
VVETVPSSALNPLGEAGRHAVAPGFQLVVVVPPLANFPILYLHDRYASHGNWNLSRTSAQKRFSMRRRKRQFTNDEVFATTDGVVLSIGIREVFTHLRQEFAQAFLVLKFEVKRMVGECELVGYARGKAFVVGN